MVNKLIKMQATFRISRTRRIKVLKFFVKLESLWQEDQYDDVTCDVSKCCLETSNNPVRNGQVSHKHQKVELLGGVIIKSGGCLNGSKSRNLVAGDAPSP